MTEAHDSRYPSVDEQAVEVYDNLLRGGVIHG